MPIDDDTHSRSARLRATGEDAPMTLKEACSAVFKDAITVASLKAEAARGNLTMRKVGRAYFVTLNDLSAMWEKCRVAPQYPASPRPRTDGKASLATFDLKFGTKERSALAALRAELKSKKPTRKKQE